MAFRLMATAANKDRGPGPQSSQHRLLMLRGCSGNHRHRRRGFGRCVPSSKLDVTWLGQPIGASTSGVPSWTSHHFVLGNPEAASGAASKRRYAA
ncbi:hypothetical protein V5799_005373 [Amblyomma americanum]|uniref:Uncharacterized protein n=1 Tax=Amblyomma americanum TaxID=6943 RepID=A0AAQ4DZF6_AMBAM